MTKSPRMSWRGFAPQLLIIVILPLAGLMALAAYGGLRMHQEEMLALAGERDINTVMGVSTTFQALLQQREQALQHLAGNVEEARPSDAEMEEYARAADPTHELFDAGLGYYQPATGRFLIADRQDFWDSLPPETLDSLAELSRPAHPVGGRYSVSMLLPGQLGDTLFMLYPGPRDWIPVGALTPASIIEPALASILTPEQEIEAFVVDRQAGLLFQSGAEIAPDEVLTHPGVEEAWNEGFGATFVETMGHPHVVAYGPLGSLEWALVMEEPWQTIASPMLRATENAPLILVPILLLSLLALWFATRRIVQPLQALEARAAEVGWGRFEAIEEPVGGILEIRNLQAELIHLAQKVRASQEGLRSYIGAITQGQEEERRRLARELHDDTLQALIALNQRLQLAELSPDDKRTDPLAADQTLPELRALAEQTIQDLRRFTRALRPIYLDELGLSAALEMLGREAGKGQQVTITFARLGEERRLPSQVELALYRIAQESLSNVLRHAQAQHAALQISYGNEMISLEVRDDGRGFTVPDSPAAFAPSGHFGLLGLHERAEMIGAQLEIASAPGQGTRLTVILPVDQLPVEATT